MSAAPIEKKPEPLLRLKQILSKFAPVHRATWWRWVKKGTAPAPITIGPGTKAWRESEILAWQNGEWPPKNKDDQPNPA